MSDVDGEGARMDVIGVVGEGALGRVGRRGP